MINSEQTIPCPVCASKIYFETTQLLSGTRFKCPNPDCDASVGLAPESKPLVQDTMKKFEELKRKVVK